MKFIFVDAENIGLTALSSLKYSKSDRVFVFSKQAAIENLCQKKEFSLFDGYPTGSNQADFFAIAVVAQVMLDLSEQQREESLFCLVTNDKAFITAFKFQCARFRAQCHIVKRNLKPGKGDKNNLSVCNLLLQNLTKPRPLNPKLREKLGLTIPQFSRAITELIKKNKIKRTKEKNREWIKC